MDTKYEAIWNQLLNDEISYVPYNSMDYANAVTKLAKYKPKEFVDHMERDILKILSKDHSAKTIFYTLLAIFLTRNKPSAECLLTMFLNSNNIEVRINSCLKPNFPLLFLLDKDSFLNEEEPRVQDSWKDMLMKREQEIAPTLRKVLINSGIKGVNSMSDDMVKKVWGYDKNFTK